MNNCEDKKELIDSANSIINDDGHDCVQINSWIEKFCLSEISDNDKIDVLMSTKLLFKDYNDFDNDANQKYETFVNLVNSKKYIYAVRLSKLLGQSYPQYKEKIREIVKGKEINFVFNDLDIILGGTGVAVIRRANNLVKRGYKINLLSTNEIQDYDAIRDYFYNEKNISENVKFINMYDYYSKRNTSTDEIQKYAVDDEDRYIIKEEKTNHSYLKYDYFDKSNPNDKIKSELIVKDALALRITHDLGKKEYYTPDGFNYLTKTKEDDKTVYCLKSIHHSGTIRFRTINQFVCHFINEYCDTVNNKPFVILDNTFSGISIKHLNPRETLKIGSIHGNPFYKGGQPEIGPDRKINKKITHFQYLDELRAFVVLTDSMKRDLKNELNYDNFVVIPNSISNDRLEYEPVEKDLNKIAIFTRVSPGKNLSDAIKAFEIVTRQNNDATLEIYGRDDYNEKENLISLVKELNMEDKVFFKEFISDVNLEMRKSLCTLMTSYYEGLPLAILESMANSTPVISYDTNYGPRDVITNNVDGIIVEFGDYEAMAESILNLLDNPQIAIDMGKKAKEKIKNEFSEDINTDKWENLFIDVYVRSEIEDYERSLKEQDYDKLNKRYIKVKKERNNLKMFKKEVVNSKSWKITKPLRAVIKVLRKLSSKD